MPSILHEALRELFAKRPDLLTPLLHSRLAWPVMRLVALDSELTDARLKQLLPDAVLASPDPQAPELIVIVEIHLHPSEHKRLVWPQYSAAAYGRYGCPVELVVVTPYRDVETWAARPIRIGQRHVMAPIVIGPTAIPLLDPDTIAEAPVLAMLSTLAHMDDPRCPRQALHTLETLSRWEEDADGRLADILQAALTVAVREKMEELMRTEKYEYQSEFARKYFARGREAGRIEGQARALLLVLRSRPLDISDAVVTRIESERDGSRLEAWTRRAITATSIDDVFADE